MQATIRTNARQCTARPAPMRVQTAGKFQVRSTMTVEPQTTTRKGMTREEVSAMHKRMEEKVKALIQLEEMEAANRPTLKISLQRKIGLGEVWKVCGTCPELGRMQPEVAPNMKWSEGDVWTLETPIRAGEHKWKIVLRNAEGAYVWESGTDRVLEVSNGLSKGATLAFENIDFKMPF